MPSHPPPPLVQARSLLSIATLSDRCFSDRPFRFLLSALPGLGTVTLSDHCFLTFSVLAQGGGTDKEQVMVTPARYPLTAGLGGGAAVRNLPQFIH